MWSVLLTCTFPGYCHCADRGTSVCTLRHFKAVQWLRELWHILTNGQHTNGHCRIDQWCQPTPIFSRHNEGVHRGWTGQPLLEDNHTWRKTYLSSSKVCQVSHVYNIMQGIHKINIIFGCSVAVNDVFVLPSPCQWRQIIQFQQSHLVNNPY